MQLLLDEERYARVDALARERGVSVARIIREAIDKAVGGRSAVRSASARRLLEAEDMPVPDAAGLREELDDLRARRA